MNPNYSGPKDNAMLDDLIAYEKSGKWMLEPKIDGMWIEVKVGDPRKGRPHLFSSRAGHEPHHDFISELQNIILPLSEGSILCGELEAGTDRATKRMKAQGFYALHLFDMLRYQEHDLKSKTQAERKEILDTVFPEIQFCTMHMPGRIQLVPSFTNLFAHRYKHFISNGGEGVVLKRKDLPFVPGKNENSIRVKAMLTDDFVLMDIGRTDGGEATGIWGQYHNGKLVYVMRAQPRSNMSILKKENFGRLVGEFKGWGRQTSGTLRSAQFVRVRTDKSPQECELKNDGDKIPTPMLLVRKEWWKNK